MRPFLLDPLFAPATTLDGVGPRLADLIANVVPADTAAREVRVGDLLFVLPHSVIDRRQRYAIADAPGGALVTLDVVISRHQPAPRGRGNVPTRVFAHDDTDEIALTFFHAKGDWLQRALPEGERMLVSGRLEWFNGRASMVHPDHMVPVARAAELPALEPVYPLTAGLSPKVLRRAILGAVERLPDLPEWLDPELIRRRSFPSLRMAFHRLHEPSDPLDIDP
ncbi:MAG TPA: ATP-dependent DNA helicase RecG, partial [Aquamicrobium sp.]|nr:ATP-dependent DNA helicase RecG [Aquamicrobium sp.]